MRRGLKTLSAVLLALTLCARAHASPIHPHCDKSTWEFRDLTPTPQPAFPIPVPEAPGTDIEFKDIMIPLTAPVTNKPDCFYELSDLTAVRLTLTVSAGTLDIIIPSVSVNGTAPNNSGPYTFFPPNDLAKTFVYPAHEGAAAGDIHLAFPNAVIASIKLHGVKTTDDILGTKILSAKVTLSGNHYFLPEPGVLTLLALSVVGPFWRRWKSRVRL